MVTANNTPVVQAESIAEATITAEPIQATAVSDRPSIHPSLPTNFTAGHTITAEEQEEYENSLGLVTRILTSQENTLVAAIETLKTQHLQGVHYEFREGDGSPVEFPNPVCELQVHMRLAVEVDKAKREELQELKDEKVQMDEDLDEIIAYAPVSSMSEVPSYIHELQGENEDLKEEMGDLHLEIKKLTEEIASVQPSALQEENEKLKAQMVTITRGLREGFACITALKEENEKLVWKR